MRCWRLRKETLLTTSAGLWPESQCQMAHEKQSARSVPSGQGATLQDIGTERGTNGKHAQKR